MTRVLITGIAFVGLLGLLRGCVVFLDAVGMGFWSSGGRYMLADARYCFTSELSMEQLVSRLDPVMKQAGYPYHLNQAKDSWYAREIRTDRDAVQDNFEWDIVPIDIPNPRGQYLVNLHPWPKESEKGDVFTKEGWRRWADLKPLVEAGTGLVLGVEKHPAVDTAPGDVARFSEELGIPPVPKDKQCD